MKKIKWGIISTGTIAKNFAETALKMGSEIEICAVASRNIESAQKFASNYNIKRAYDSYEKLAEDKDIDIIYVATPHNLHYENMLMCLNNNKSVLCEKSFTVTSEQAKEIYMLAKEKGLFVMEAFWTKFLPIYADVEKVINDGAIGDVKMVTAQYGYCTSAAREVRKFDPNLAGGTLLDIGVYAIGFAAMMLGYSPTKIQTSVKLNNVGTDEYSGILLEYEEGKIAQLTTAIGTILPIVGCIYGSLGHINIKEFNSAQSIDVVLNDGTSYTIENKFDINGYECEIREVMKCLSNGKQYSDILTPTQSIAIMDIMDKVRQEWNMKFPFEK